jgi:PAS domain S-box-containing protein
MKSNSKAIEIRKRAEELLKNKESKPEKQLSEADLLKLIHEYEVRQIELELMNDELLQKDLILTESENKYRTVFENIQDVYYRIDLNGIIVDISPSITQLGGYIREDIIGTEVSDYYYSTKDRELFLNTIKQTQIVNDYELRFKNKSGGVIYTSVNAHIGFDTNGKPDYIEGIIRDISERKQVEAKLKESEEKYRELVENSPDSIAIYEDGKLVYANNVLVQLLAAKNSEELIGMAVLQFIHPDSRALVIERMKKVATEGITLPFVEEKIISLDGSTIDVEIKAIPINLGNKQAVQLIIHNLTESKIEEARLKRSEEKYRTIFNNVQDVFYQNDINGIIKEISPSIKYFTEFSREELIGSNASLLYYDPKARKEFLEILYKDKEVRDFEFRLKTKTDDIRYVSINARLIYDINDNPDHIDGSLRDITQRKLAEDSLKKSEALLRSIAETSTDVIFVKDREYRFVFINPAGCKFNGKTQEQLIGKSKADFNPSTIQC